MKQPAGVVGSGSTLLQARPPQHAHSISFAALVIYCIWPTLQLAATILLAPQPNCSFAMVLSFLAPRQCAPEGEAGEGSWRIYRQSQEAPI